MTEASTPRGAHRVPLHEEVIRDPDEPVTWMRCARDKHDHAVTDSAYDASIRLQTGTFSAVCEASVLASSMTTTPGPRCAKYRLVLMQARPVGRFGCGAARRRGRHRPGAATRQLITSAIADIVQRGRP